MPIRNSILENTATTSGNVILGDAKGGVADINSSDTGLTLTTAGTFVGKYGTLVIAANGTYTYTLDNANPTVNALNPGQRSRMKCLTTPFAMPMARPARQR